MNAKEIIKKGLAQISERRDSYEKFQRYYDGNHDLAFATAKFKKAFGDLFKTFADNLIPVVVNGIADNLLVDNFAVDSGGDAEFSAKAWQLWQDNYLEQRSNDIHRHVLLKGDAYLLIWFDEQKRAVIYPNKAENCTVGYDEEIPGKILWAIKTWKAGNRTRLNLFLPDKIIKYETGFRYSADNINFKEIETLENPFGEVPVFHFANQSGFGDFGRSEVESVIPLNDALNKLLLDMLVASEFGAFPQRWATGIEQVVDSNGKEISPFTGGAMGIWAVNSETAKFGDFTTTDLEQFVKLQESLRAEVARVASIPLHYLMLQSGNFPSGKALQTAERRFTVKIKMLQTKFGEVWAKAMAFALRLHEAKPNLRLITQWKDNTVISEKETFENLQMKRSALQIPFARLWEEAGYGTEEIKAMLEQRRAEIKETPLDNK